MYYIFEPYSIINITPALDKDLIFFQNENCKAYNPRKC